MPEYQQIQRSKKPDTTFQKQATPVIQTPVSNPYSIIQRAKINPKSLTHADIMQLQRNIGNRAVGRLLPSIGSSSTPHQATVQRQEIPEEEEPLQTKRENNTGLPDNLKGGVESLSGIDMSDVRVQHNSDKPAEVGALAYTQGADIHVAPRQERHLPHEAWHVVQQKQGRVQPTMQLKNGVPVNDDVRLESEADVMGEQAFTSGQNVFFNHGEYNPGSRGGQELIAHELMHVVQQKSDTLNPIQRLMDLDTFKQITDVKWAYKRNKVTKIDSLIEEYHSLPPTSYGDRSHTLDKIFSECNKYLGLPDSKAKRKPGVWKLLNEVSKEKKIYTNLKSFADDIDLQTKYKFLVAAQDAAFDTKGYDYKISITNATIINCHIGQELIKLMSEIRKNPETLAQLIQDDVDQLRKLSQDNSVPPVTRSAIEKLLANENKIHFEDMRPGTRLAKNTEREQHGKKYIVTNFLAPPGNGGTAEILGGWVHELTHVSAGESFANTIGFLLYNPALTIDKIVELVNSRLDKVKELEGLAQADRTFSEDQRRMLLFKLKYARESKMKEYAEKFKSEDKAMAEKFSEISAAIPEGNNTLIEYDSVMNQMLLYLHIWKVQEDNTFYIRLREIANEANMLRLAH